jgi:hypothetical protein
MPLRLVDDDLDVSLELPLDDFIREAIGIQMQRSIEGNVQQRFKLQLMERIVELVDADLQPPSMKQLIYAIDISKSLHVTVPSEAFRFRGAMFEFIKRFAPLYKEKLRHRKSPSSNEE